jgi:hypothetical protein
MDGWMDGMGKRENTHDHDPHKFGSGPFDFEPLRRISGPFGPPPKDLRPIWAAPKDLRPIWAAPKDLRPIWAALKNPRLTIRLANETRRMKKPRIIGGVTPPPPSSSR